jgi:hypothetical protein
MRAALALEWIGYDQAPLGRAAHGHAIERHGHWQATDTSRPWVARITGPDTRYGLARRFVEGQIDFSQANSVGSRGVMLYFALAPGVYEVYARVSWTRSRRYFCQAHEDASITEMTREEVEQWLARLAASASVASASPS